MNTKIGFIVALLCSVAVAGAAQASTTVAGSYAITTSGTADVSVTKNFSSPFSMPLTVGTPFTTNFFTITSTDSFGLGNSQSLGVNANFTFTQPSDETFTDHGTGSIKITGFTTLGTLSWSDGTAGTNVSFDDGALLNINLSNVTFASGFGEDSETVKATFTLVHGATAVPEPASLALLGSALIGWTAIRRRRNS